MCLETDTQALIAICKADKKVMAALAYIERKEKCGVKNWGILLKSFDGDTRARQEVQAALNEAKIKYHTARRLQGKKSKLAGCDQVTIRDLFDMLGGL